MRCRRPRHAELAVVDAARFWISKSRNRHHHHHLNFRFRFSTGWFKGGGGVEVVVPIEGSSSSGGEAGDVAGDKAGSGEASEEGRDGEVGKNTAGEGGGAEARGGLIKAEPKDPDEKMSAMVEAFLKEPMPTKLKLQSMEVACDSVLRNGRDSPMLVNFCDAMNKHVESVRKMLKAVTRVVQGSEVNMKKMPAAMRALESLYTKQKSLIEFAELNNLCEKAGRKRSRADKKEKKD